MSEGVSQNALLRSIAGALGLEDPDLSEPRSCFVRTSDKLDLHLLDWGGNGPPVLLLHGGSLAARTWDYLALLLRGGHRLIALDLRGHGDSGWSGDYSVERFALDGLEALEAMGVSRYHLVGMSLGGLIAAEIALADADRVRSLALVDVAPGARLEATVRMRSFFATAAEMPSVDTAVELAMKASPNSNPERLRYRMAFLLRKNSRGLMQWKRDERRMAHLKAYVERIDNLAQRVGGFERPVLLLRGARSPALSSESAEAFAGKCQRGRWREIADAGHNIQEDNPVVLAAALGEFWTSEDAVSRSRS